MADRSGSKIGLLIIGAVVLGLFWLGYAIFSPSDPTGPCERSERSAGLLLRGQETLIPADRAEIYGNCERGDTGAIEVTTSYSDDSITRGGLNMDDFCQSLLGGATILADVAGITQVDIVNQQRELVATCKP